MDEIKSHGNFFVLLDWYDTISLYAIFKTRITMENMKNILMALLAHTLICL